MVIKAKKVLHDKLSRKELQNMCKLYGLPANKSHSQLKKSLLAFVEEGILQKASHAKCNEGHVNDQNVEKKSSADMEESRPETDRRDADDDSCPPHDAFTSPSDCSAKLRSKPFQFYVKSEDGLNLCVDLTSSPSDWTKKFKRDVHIFENVQHSKSRSLHNDIECLKGSEREISSFKNINLRGIRDGTADSHTSPCSEADKIDRPEINQSPKDQMALNPHCIHACSVHTDISDKSKDNKLSACPNRDSHLKPQCALIVDFNVTEARNYSEPIVLEHSMSNLDRCQNMIPENDSGLQNPSVVHRRGSVGSSIEMQTSEVASCNKDTSGSHLENGLMGESVTEDDKESEKHGVVNLRESKQMPIPAEEQERSNSLNERKSSECSKLINESEKICLNSDINTNGGKQKRKKNVEESGQESSPYQPNVKILRSMKRKQDLPRRSTRLQTK